MIDPLAEVVTLLQPGARFSKLVLGASPWRVSRSDAGQSLYCVILEGACRMAIDGHEPIELVSGDFVLIPAAHDVTMSSLVPPPPGVQMLDPIALGNNEFRIGEPDGPVDSRMVGEGLGRVARRSARGCGRHRVGRCDRRSDQLRQAGAGARSGGGDRAAGVRPPNFGFDRALSLPRTLRLG